MRTREHRDCTEKVQLWRVSGEVIDRKGSDRAGPGGGRAAHKWPPKFLLCPICPWSPPVGGNTERREHKKQEAREVSVWCPVASSSQGGTGMVWEGGGQGRQTASRTTGLQEGRLPYKGHPWLAPGQDCSRWLKPRGLFINGWHHERDATRVRLTMRARPELPHPTADGGDEAPSCSLLGTTPHPLLCHSTTAR